MGYQMLCLGCFHIKGDYEVCPYCGYIEGNPPKELFQLKPGTILHNRYIIGTAIGCGGFGIIYRAYDTVLSIIVAIKEFFPAKLVNRAEGETKVGVFSGGKAEEYHKRLERFINEARSIAIFANEKDIVNVLDYFKENGTAYIIMEYIEAPSLKVHIKQYGKMNEDQACSCMCEILSALQKIHDKGIIHKDISPDNIFLLPQNHVKILDFGAARLQDDTSDCNMSVVVKAGYAPPEQYRSKSIQDLRVDIYAAGAVFYYMLTGDHPIESLERISENHRQVKLPSSMGIKMHSYIEKALVKALSLKPEDRFGSAEEFRSSLLAPPSSKNFLKRWLS